MRACPRLRPKGACACGLSQVLNIRLGPSPLSKQEATMKLQKISWLQKAGITTAPTVFVLIVAEK